MSKKNKKESIALLAEEGGTITADNSTISGFDRPAVARTGGKISLNGATINADSLPSWLDQIGLPKDTPHNLLIEVIEHLLKNENEQSENKEELLSKRLFDWIGNSANATTIAANLITLSQNGYIQTLLNIIPK